MIDVYMKMAQNFCGKLAGFTVVLSNYNIVLMEGGFTIMYLYT